MGKSECREVRMEVTAGSGSTAWVVSGKREK